MNNENRNWPAVVFAGVVICIIWSIPAQVLGALLGIGLIVGFAVLVVAGFFYFLRYLDATPPWYVLVGALLFCLIFYRAGLGLFLGIGLVGGLFLLTVLSLNNFR